jgi:hypothetical protein
MATASAASKTRFGRIYLVRLDGHLKLGFTKNLDKRLRLLGDASPKVELIEWVDGTSYIERQIHEMVGGGTNGFYHFDYEQTLIEAMHSMSIGLTQY